MNQRVERSPGDPRVVPSWKRGDSFQPMLNFFTPSLPEGMQRKQRKGGAQGRSPWKTNVAVTNPRKELNNQGDLSRSDRQPRATSMYPVLPRLPRVFDIDDAVAC